MTVYKDIVVRDPESEIESIPYILNFNKAKYLSLTNAILKTLHGTSNTRVFFFGDSTTTGANETAGNEVANSYVEQLSENLSYSMIPVGWQTVYGSARDEATGSVFTHNAADNRVTDYPAGWATFEVNTAIGGTVAFNGTTTNPITFVPTVPTDTLDLYYIDANVAHDQIVVKNGAATIGTAVMTGGFFVKKLSCPTTLGLNTYTIQRAGIGTNAYIVGYEAYNSAKKEITFINAGQSASVITTSFSKVPVSTSNWHTMNALTKATPTKGDAVFINFGINHWLTPTSNTPAKFRASLDYAVNTLDTAGVPVVLITPPASPITSASMDLQQQYINIIIDVANTYGITVIDNFGYWGTHAEAFTKGWMHNVANVHPSRLGHGVEASLIADFFKLIARP